MEQPANEDTILTITHALQTPLHHFFRNYSYFFEFIFVIDLIVVLRVRRIFFADAVLAAIAISQFNVKYERNRDGSLVGWRSPRKNSCGGKSGAC